ncbi:MAG: peptidylprolyl isomerase [Nanohaloarchaea archaeon SW_4_43_9]|nr:MAG: peptidylprolyl isomerase [Nanohaloarchaea archaeon SW_4_43_9]
MEKGDMVLADYIGKADGEIFDLTVEEKAQEEGMSEDRDFKPIPVLIGKNYVIEGFEEALLDMEVGDQKEVEISSDKAYGERDSGAVETYPEKEFKKQDVQVRRGEELMIGNRRGKVVSKGSGRVRIDFNHPLAGKDLKYDIRVKEKVEDDEEIAKYIMDYRIGHGSEDMEFDGDKVKVPGTHSHGDHEHELPEEVREKLTEEITEYTGFEEIEFTE